MNPIVRYNSACLYSQQLSSGDKKIFSSRAVWAARRASSKSTEIVQTLSQNNKSAAFLPLTVTFGDYSWTK